MGLGIPNPSDASVISRRDESLRETWRWCVSRSLARAAAMLASVAPRPAPPAPSPRHTRPGRHAVSRREPVSTRRASTRGDTETSTSETSTSTKQSAVRPDGFGFSAAGMIFPYHCGAWEVLDELGMLTPDTPVAGASAGALVAAMHACGISPAEGKRILLTVLGDCRENGVVGRVGGVLESALRAELPANAHTLCSRGKLFVSITSPRIVSKKGDVAGFNKGPLLLENELISEFTDFDDLIGALLSSCHIPVYCGWPMRRYRGKWCVDGGWTNLTPLPMGCESPARVASFPLIDAWHTAPPGDGSETGNYFEQQAGFWSDWGVSELNGRLIAPDAAEGTSPVEYTTLGKWALLPQSDDTLNELAAMGRADAERWAAKNGHVVERECQDACPLTFD